MYEHVPQSPAATAADALPTWITPEVIEDTLRTWQRYYRKPLTHDDAIEILLNTGNLFRILQGDKHEQLQNRGDDPCKQPQSV